MFFLIVPDETLRARSSLRVTLEIQAPVASVKLQDTPLTLSQAECDIETKDENLSSIFNKESPQKERMGWR